MSKHHKIGSMEVSRITGLSRSNISMLCKTKNAKLDKKGRYRLFLFEWKTIILSKHFEILEKYYENAYHYDATPEIIYVNTIWEVRESKMNYLTLNQL